MFNDVIFFYREIDALKHRRPIRNSNTQQLSYLSYRMSAAVYKPGTGIVPTRGQSRPSLWLSYFISAIIYSGLPDWSVVCVSWLGFNYITLTASIATPRMPLRTHLECAFCLMPIWTVTGLCLSHEVKPSYRGWRTTTLSSRHHTSSSIYYTLYQNLSYPSMLHSTPSHPTYDFIKQFCTFFCLNPLLQSAWH